MPRVWRVCVGTPNAVLPGIMTTNLGTLKGRFLTAIGYVCARRESANDAFDRLRLERPDLFPVPRCNESFWDAIAQVAEDTTHEVHIDVPALKSYAFATTAIETLGVANAMKERTFKFVEMIVGAGTVEFAK
jgi:hypothetical protein